MSSVPPARRVNAWVALARGSVKRCPRCGARGIFLTWFQLPERCPRCGLAFERGDGFWLGSMAINLGATEATFGAFGIAFALATWPNVPWALLTVLAIALNGLLPFVFFPFSKTIFLAIDMMLHQVDEPGAHELDDSVPLPARRRG